MPEQEEEDFLLWPEHEDALDLFMRCQTQWRVGGLGQVTGFCYESVIALANIYKYDDLKTVLDDLQVMEIRAIEILNKEQK